MRKLDQSNKRQQKKQEKKKNVSQDNMTMLNIKLN